MRIALLDGDATQAGPIGETLRAAGHSCEIFSNAAALLNDPGGERFEMLVIDWDAADGNGMAALRWARTKPAPRLPVLVIAGRSNEEGIAAALDGGADDYLIKPIRRSELQARVRILLRRACPERSESQQLRFGEYLFDTGASRVSFGGRGVELTQKEFDLALLFFRHLGRPLSRAYIAETIWSHDIDTPSRTVDTHVSRIRSKLELRKENGFRLAPVYSYGYLLEQLARQ